MSYIFLICLSRDETGECTIAGGVASHCTSIEAARVHALQIALETMGPGLMKRMKSAPKSFKELLQRNKLIRRSAQDFQRKTEGSPGVCVCACVCVCVYVCVRVCEVVVRVCARAYVRVYINFNY